MITMDQNGLCKADYCKERGTKVRVEAINDVKIRTPLCPFHALTVKTAEHVDIQLIERYNIVSSTL